MKKLLQKMGWINYRDKIDYNEITIDILFIFGMGIIIWIAKIV